VGRFDDQAFAYYDYAIPGDRALIRREPDLALATVIETDEYGDTVVGDHSARLTIAAILRLGRTRRFVDSPRLSSATRRGPFSGFRHPSIDPEQFAETRVARHPPPDRIA
jgi:hypothetical protein